MLKKSDNFAGKTLIAGMAAMLLAIGGCEKAEQQAAKSPADPKQSEIKDGQRWYATSCAVCHGFTGQGMPHQGQALRNSEFIAQSTDSDLVEFIKAGRQPSDPKSALKLLMPPKGNNPSLTDKHLAQIVAYLRDMQREAGMIANPASAGSSTTGSAVTSTNSPP